MMIDKKHIAERFQNAISTYNSAAIVQKEMAMIVSELIAQEKNNYQNILEIGSGTGLLTQELLEKVKYDRYCLNDLVDEPTQLFSNQLNFKFMPGDIEKIKLPENLSLVVSNSTFQWIKDLTKLLQRIYDALSADGILVFQTYGPSNLNEIKHLTGQGLTYYSLLELINILEDLNFEVVHKEEAIRVLDFDNPLEVLKHIKATGVSGNADKQYQLRYKHFKNEYIKHFSSKTGVRLTYHPIIIQVRKHG